MMNERSILRLSIAMTFLVAATGIVFGLLSGSYAIIFDGVYALGDAALTVVALLVTNLIAASTAAGQPRSRLIERFTMGFWHLEPIVLLLNGTLLIGASVYALINAILSLLAGGHTLAFDIAILYAAVTLAVCLGMAIFDRRANRRIKSDFLALDSYSWMMSAAITGALLVAFTIGYFIQGTSYQYLSPYIDPLVLALVSLVIIPLPIGTVRQALADILLVTPSDLKRHVDEVAEAIVARHGFLSYRSYVARVGRGRQIELYFIAPVGWPAKTLEEWDALRDEIGAAIGGEGPDRWLTIAFTTDREWAD